MAQSKATKKFEKRHLGDTLKRRKEVSKFKQKQHIKAKKKAQKAEDVSSAVDVDAGEKESKDHQFDHMTVDDFFQGGFDIPEKPKAKRKRGISSQEKAVSKRKKPSLEIEKANEQDSDESEEPNTANQNGEGSESEAESDQDLDRHKEQLQDLADKDPEFYKYLQENDTELLDFEHDNFPGIEDLSGDEDEAKATPTGTDEDDSGDGGLSTKNNVSMTLVETWKSAMMEKKSLRSTKEVVLAFRGAAHLSEDDGREYKYTVTDADVYNELLVVALKHIPEVLQEHLPVKESSSGKVTLATDSKKYRTIAPMLKSHVSSILHLLSNLSDGATVRLTLSSIISLLPYIMVFRKLIKELAKSTVSIWSDPSSTEASRISAFLILRKLVVIGDAGIKEAVLKTTYQGLVKGSRNTTQHTIQGVNLMKNSAAELWGVDPTIGYTTGFVFIRQLAIHLRSTIANNTKDSYKVIYNWQYVHSLDFWSRVLSHHCSSLREAELGKESPLRPLIYPVVQVSLGAMRLIPTAQYFPLRFQLIRSLIRISLATTTYIPLAPALYEVLTSAEMRKPPKPTTLKIMDFSTSIRAGKSYLRTRVYQEGAGEQVTELLSEFFVLWTKSIAFPELALPTIVMLKRWLKEATNKNTGNKNGKVNSAIALLVQKLEANSRWIEDRRLKVDFAPNNRAGVEGFLKEEAWERSPLGAFVAGQRKMREEKARLVEEGRREQERRKDDDDEKEESGDSVDEAQGAFDGEQEDEDMSSNE